MLIEIVKKYKLIIILYFIAVLNLYIAMEIVDVGIVRGDSTIYRHTIEYLQGEFGFEDASREANVGRMKSRILTGPLFLYSAVFFDKISGSPYLGMLIVNFIFYLFLVYVFFKFASRVYDNEKVGFWAAILFITNYSIYNFGTVCMSDIGGWFFFVLTSWLAVNYYKSQEKKYFYYTIAAASVGVLFKEYGALGMISLGLLILISNYSWQRKFKEIFVAGCLFLILPLIWHVYVYLNYHITYFDWWGLDTLGQSGTYDPLIMIKVLGWLYIAGWPIFLYGAWQEWKGRKWDRIKVLLALLPASLAFFAWGTMTQRIAFILIIWLAPISAYGLYKIKNQYLVWGIVVFYILVGLNMNWLIKAINLF